MATLVGTQTDFSRAVKELVELDFDAVEAYEAAINRIENSAYKSKLEEFKKDRQRHVQELSGLLREHEEDPPTGPSMGKQWLTKGKIILANLISDKTILAAMKTNEDDANTAYERMVAHEDKWEDAAMILQRGLQDERRHREWLEKTINAPLAY